MCFQPFSPSSSADCRSSPAQGHFGKPDSFAAQKAFCHSTIQTRPPLIGFHKEGGAEVRFRAQHVSYATLSIVPRLAISGQRLPVPSPAAAHADTQSLPRIHAAALPQGACP
ncbi:hypothetical protein AAFF_G00213840 [Aldrovandia affinis]|uniref:Uncharacterized protein n=1 Tax=Aldrovandia affinis TaxID=143900 RepID=A0AAD7W4H1_9TELE|nr:hypothetical protein AAFF_G00213840 [Aldrovandia affinis]